MAWDQNLSNLNYILAGYYPFKNDSLAVARKAGLNILNIGFNDKPVTNWYNIIDIADKENKVDQLIKSALADFPEDITLKGALAGDLNGVTNGVILDDQATWKDGDTDTFEKIIGKESTLLDIAYLETGLL